MQSSLFNSFKNDQIETGGSYTLLANQLIQTLPTIYEQVYPELWTLSGENAVPVAGNLAGYTTTINEVTYEAKGAAKEYVDNTSDIPTLRSAYGNDNFNIHKFTLASEHSIEEIKAMAVQPQIMSKELSAIDQSLRQLTHELLLFGNESRQSEGLFNNALIPSESGSYDPANGNLTWEQHLNFFSEKIADIEDNNNDSVRVGKIFIPNKLYSQLVRTRMNGDSSVSVMQAMKMDYPEVSFQRVNETRAGLLERYGVRPSGTGEDRLIFMPVNNNNAFDRLADAPDAMQPYWKDLTYRTIYFHRSSQTMVHRPKSFLYYDIPSFN